MGAAWNWLRAVFNGKFLALAVLNLRFLLLGSIKNLCYVACNEVCKVIMKYSPRGMLE
jgi:hypothetical protein